MLRSSSSETGGALKSLYGSVGTFHRAKDGVRARGSLFPLSFPVPSNPCTTVEKSCWEPPLPAYRTSGVTSDWFSSPWTQSLMTYRPQSNLALFYHLICFSYLYFRRHLATCWKEFAKVFHLQRLCCSLLIPKKGKARGLSCPPSLGSPQKLTGINQTQTFRIHSVMSTVIISPSQRETQVLHFSFRNTILSQSHK